MLLLRRSDTCELCSEFCSDGWVFLHIHSGYNFFVQDHVEGYLALSGKTKTYFATAVSLWDADFYVKVDDDVHVNIGNLPVRTSRSLLIFS